MAEARKRIAVIGGANMDIGGFSAKSLLDGDSNPGRVNMSVGGVGRNIAENLVRLGFEVELISAIGGDPNGSAILRDCAEKGVGTQLCLLERQMRSSVYLFISDVDGDMHCAINDMEIQDCLTPAAMAERIERINQMDAAVIDANLPAETIRFLAEKLRIPIFADAVSAAKVARLREALPYLYALKPNRIEAELLSGIAITCEADAYRAARTIAAMGVKRVYLSMSVDGAICVENERCVRIAGRRLEMRNASGAGDAFTSALVWAWAKGLDMEESCLAGMAAAAIAVKSISAVNPQMSEALLQTQMLELKQQEEEYESLS